MDVGDLLREARRQAGLSQRLLASAAETSQPAVAAWESGRVSPTVKTLDRLLAACGLQARVQLEPLLADVDSRVDELVSGEAVFDTDGVPNLVLTLTDDPEAMHGNYGARPIRKGPVTWAFDGHSALQLHGLAVAGRQPALAVVLDEAARYWLRAIGAHALSSTAWPVHWLEDEAAVIAQATREPFFSLVSLLSLRIVDELPPTVDLSVPWSDRPVPVLTVDAVEQGHPQHAELLARLRARRSLTA